MRKDKVYFTFWFVLFDASGGLTKFTILNCENQNKIHIQNGIAYLPPALIIYPLCINRFIQINIRQIRVAGNKCPAG